MALYPGVTARQRQTSDMTSELLCLMVPG